MALKNLLLALFLFCNVIIAEPVNKGHAEVSLVKSSQVNSDGKLHAGIKMDMQSGWHTYWINPGDSGGALKATWDIPKGNSVSEVKFPKPHKIPYPPLMTFGYENEVIFPIEIDLKDANNNIIKTINKSSIDDMILYSQHCKKCPDQGGKKRWNNSSDPECIEDQGECRDCSECPNGKRTKFP